MTKNMSSIMKNEQRLYCQQIPVKQIKFFSDNINVLNPNKYTMLVDSIKNEGLLEPLSVIPIKNDRQYKYVVVNGNHRLMACNDLNIKTVPCIVNNKNDNALRLCVHMNNLRGETNVEKLIAVITGRLNRGDSIGDIADDLQMKPWWVAQHYNMSTCKIAISKNITSDVVCVPAFIPASYNEDALKHVEKLSRKMINKSFVKNTRDRTTREDWWKLLSMVDVGMFYGQLLTEKLETGTPNAEFYVKLTDDAVRKLSKMSSARIDKLNAEYDKTIRLINKLKAGTFERRQIVKIKTHLLKHILRTIMNDSDIVHELSLLGNKQITMFDAETNIKKLIAKKISAAYKEIDVIIWQK